MDSGFMLSKTCKLWNPSEEWIIDRSRCRGDSADNFDTHIFERRELLYACWRVSVIYNIDHTITIDFLRNNSSIGYCAQKNNETLEQLVIRAKMEIKLALHEAEWLLR